MESRWTNSDLADLNKLNHKPAVGKAKKQTSATKEPQELQHQGPLATGVKVNVTGWVGSLFQKELNPQFPFSCLSSFKAFPDRTLAGG